MSASQKVSSGFVTLDSGKRQEFDTGAVRDTQDDKPRFELIPVGPLTRVAELYARGAKKYGDRNWQKGIPDDRVYASLLRHVYAAMEGDVTEDHLAAVVFNVFALMYYQENTTVKLTPAQPPTFTIAHKFNVGDKVSYPAHNVTGEVTFRGDIGGKPAYGVKLADGEMNGFTILVPETDLVANPQTPKPKYKKGDRVEFLYLNVHKGRGEVVKLPGEQLSDHFSHTTGKNYHVKSVVAGKLLAMPESEIVGLVGPDPVKLPIDTWVTVTLPYSTANPTKCRILKAESNEGYDYYVRSEQGNKFWIRSKEITKVHAKFKVGDFVAVQGFSTRFYVTKVYEYPVDLATYDLEGLPYTLNNHHESLLSKVYKEVA